MVAAVRRAARCASGQLSQLLVRTASCGTAPAARLSARPAAVGHRSCTSCLTRLASATPDADRSTPCFTCPSPCGCATPCCSFAQLLGKSLFSDVYATPSQWRPLTLGTLFSEGWNESWVSPVNGSGGAPRQGWINAQDGVFYRLAFTGFTARQDLAAGGNRYLGYTTVFLPVSRRFEVRVDVPFVASNPVPSGGYHSAFGDLTIYPRVLLHETQNTTIVAEMPIRTGTGSTVNGNGYTSIGPNVSFWRNVTNGWYFAAASARRFRRATIRSMFARQPTLFCHRQIHYAARRVALRRFCLLSIDRGAHAGRQPLRPELHLFQPHAWLSLPLGNNWYALGGVEVPVVHPVPYQYAPTAWLMKVF